MPAVGYSIRPLQMTLLSGTRCIVSMPAIPNQFVGNELHGIKRRSANAQPDIVHRQISGKRQSFVEKLFPESHAAAQEIVTNEVSNHAFRARLAVAKRVTHHPHARIHYAAIADHQRAALQMLHHHFHFAGFPHVVLVGKEDVISLRHFQRVLKVIDRRFEALAGIYLYAPVAECFNRFYRVVCRRVIGDNYFIPPPNCGRMESSCSLIYLPPL